MKNKMLSDGTEGYRYEDRKTDFYYRHDKNGTHSLSCHPHLHYHIEFFYLKEGRVDVWIDAEKSTVNAGDMLICFPNQVHQYKADESAGNEKYYIFIVSPDLVPEFSEIFKSGSPNSPIIKNIGDDSFVLNLLEGMAEIAKVSGGYSDEMRRGFLLAIFGRIFPLMSFDEVKTGDSRALRNVVDFCSKNYAMPLSLEMLEGELHLNKYYISHLFSGKLGIRLNDYVNSLRISHACRMLREGKMSITEISDAVGFNTLRTFNRSFAKLRGCSPSEYRRDLPERSDTASML